MAIPAYLPVIKLAGLLLLSAVLSSTALAARWYSPGQITRGQTIFVDNCASCHGDQGKGALNWNKLLPDGQYPPPPLNGTAHAWHHPLSALKLQIKAGGKPVGGKMPAFNERLDDVQVESVIAYFQSLWSDEIYAAWASRNTDLPKTAKSAVAGNTRYLEKRLKNVQISEPEATVVEGILRSKVGNDYVYITKDGRYAFLGDLVDLKSGANLTERIKARDNLEMLANFSEQDMTIYSAQSKEKSVITIYTDTRCPDCQKLHAEVGVLQRAGVTVRYIPFSQSGTRGTPTIFLPNGRKLDGYLAAAQLLKLLE